MDLMTEFRFCLQRFSFALFAAAFLFSGVKSGLAQQNAPEAQPQEGMVKLTLPDELELSDFIDFVSERLGVKFLYDEKVSNNKISVRAPGPIPVDSLMDVLKSALKMKGFALVDADVEGWMRIEQVEDLSKIAEPRFDPEIGEVVGTKVITQTFRIKNLEPAQIETIVKPFLTEKGANTIVVAEQDLLIITDYAKNLGRIADLIAKIDQA
ncbi:MAG: hypothetical protein KDD52_09920, partial [Bdellovibrionales bacterium]|nr:hypothetical protein [Bdellovibrionales bacterium]